MDLSQASDCANNLRIIMYQELNLWYQFTKGEGALTHELSIDVLSREL